MSGHTRFEKRLRRDISAKNQLRKQIELRIQKIRQWEEQLTDSVSTRWRKRYASTIARFQQEIEQLKAALAAENAELAARINKEMEFSEAEVAEFEKQFTTERAEAVAKRSEYEQALAEKRKQEELLSDATAEEAAEINTRLSKVISKVHRLKRQVGKEDKDVDKVSRELDAEARDRELFASELQRIVAENAHFGL